MDRMADSGSDDGGSSPLVVTNKTKKHKKERKLAFNFFFVLFRLSARSAVRKCVAQRSTVLSCIS